MEKEYVLKIFVAGLPGCYQYTVGVDKDQALEHFSNIVRDGYRRINERGQLVQHMPRTLEKVVLMGPDLNTKYPDTIIST